MIFENNEKKAERLHQLAMTYKAENQGELAETTYKEALKLDHSRATTWYNLGLMYKYQKHWQESFQANLEAHKLCPKDEAACWNLGIAATALHDWRNARAAWKDYGIEIADGDDSIKMDYGMIPIRLEVGEVVWCNRIDPARGVVMSIPFPDSGYWYGDIILHDGAPNGYRVVNGNKVPVFDVLDIWEHSSYQVFEIEAIIRQEMDYNILEERIDSYPDMAIEDWGSVRILCKKCSEGIPHEHHDAKFKKFDSKRKIAIALKEPKLLDEIFRLWTEGEVINCTEIKRMN